MCGIFGYVGSIKKGKEKDVYRLMLLLAEETEIRGKHSAGFFAASLIPNDDKNYTTVIEKQAIRPKKFFNNSEEFKKAIIDNKAFSVICHNRFATHGTINNTNAHPFEGDNYVLVHNGVYLDHEELKKKYKIKNHKDRTDSESILLCLDKYGKLDRTFFSDINNYSLCMFEYKTATTYWIRDDDKPMFIADMRKTLGIRVFASTQKIFIGALIRSFRKNKVEKYFSSAEGFNTASRKLYSCTSYLTGEIEGKDLNIKKKIKRKRRKIKSYDYDSGKVVSYIGHGNIHAPTNIHTDDDYWARRYNKWKGNSNVMVVHGD